MGNELYQNNQISSPLAQFKAVPTHVLLPYKVIQHRKTNKILALKQISINNDREKRKIDKILSMKLNNKCSYVTQLVHWQHRQQGYCSENVNYVMLFGNIIPQTLKNYLQEEKKFINMHQIDMIINTVLLSLKYYSSIKQMPTRIQMSSILFDGNKAVFLDPWLQNDEGSFHYVDKYSKLPQFVTANENNNMNQLLYELGLLVLDIYMITQKKVNIQFNKQVKVHQVIQEHVDNFRLKSQLKIMLHDIPQKRKLIFDIRVPEKTDQNQNQSRRTNKLMFNENRPLKNERMLGRHQKSLKKINQKRPLSLQASAHHFSHSLDKSKQQKAFSKRWDMSKQLKQFYKQPSVAQSSFTYARMLKTPTQSVCHPSKRQSPKDKKTEQIGTNRWPYPHKIININKSGNINFNMNMSWFQQYEPKQSYSYKNEKLDNYDQHTYSTKNQTRINSFNQNQPLEQFRILQTHQQMSNHSCTRTSSIIENTINKQPILPIIQYGNSHNLKQKQCYAVADKASHYQGKGLKSGFSFGKQLSTSSIKQQPPTPSFTQKFHQFTLNQHINQSMFVQNHKKLQNSNYEQDKIKQECKKMPVNQSYIKIEQSNSDASQYIHVDNNHNQKLETSSQIKAKQAQSIIFDSLTKYKAQPETKRNSLNNTSSQGKQKQMKDECETGKKIQQKLQNIKKIQKCSSYQSQQTQKICSQKLNNIFSAKPMYSQFNTNRLMTSIQNKTCSSSDSVIDTSFVPFTAFSNLQKARQKLNDSKKYRFSKQKSSNTQSKNTQNQITKTTGCINNTDMHKGEPFSQICLSGQQILQSKSSSTLINKLIQYKQQSDQKVGPSNIFKNKRQLSQQRVRGISQQKSRMVCGNSYQSNSEVDINFIQNQHLQTNTQNQQLRYYIVQNYPSLQANQTKQERYEGYKRNGVRQGHGIYYYAHGYIYDGNWHCNQPNGYGILYKQKADKYNPSRFNLPTLINTFDNHSQYEIVLHGLWQNGHFINSINNKIISTETIIDKMQSSSLQTSYVTSIVNMLPPSSTHIAQSSNLNVQPSIMHLATPFPNKMMQTTNSNSSVLNNKNTILSINISDQSTSSTDVGNQGDSNKKYQSRHSFKQPVEEIKELCIEEAEQEDRNQINIKNRYAQLYNILGCVRIKNKDQDIDDVDNVETVNKKQYLQVSTFRLHSGDIFKGIIKNASFSQQSKRQNRMWVGQIYKTNGQRINGAWQQKQYMLHPLNAKKQLKKYSNNNNQSIINKQ